MLESLNIVRDCWWAMPSGSRYLMDENGQLSSQAHGLYSSLNASDTEYIRASDSGEVRYYGRLESTNINTTAVDINIRAACTPPGSAVLYINNRAIKTFNVSTKNDYTENVELNDAQREQIHAGRILSNYDYFDVKLGCHSGTTMAYLYDVNIAYSGSATWENYKTGLPNVIREIYQPTQFLPNGGVTWSGTISDINDGIYASGVDDTYVKLIHPGGYKSQWIRGKPMPSGNTILRFRGFTAATEVDTIYDEYGMSHGSGVGIGIHSFQPIAPSGIGGYSIVASGAVGHVAMGRALNMGSGDYSMECWIRTDTTGVLTPCVGATRSAGGTQSRWYVGIQTTNVGRVYLNMSASTYQFDGTTNVCDGEWHHLAATIKRDGNLTLYVDGTSEGTPVSVAANEGYDAQMPVGTQLMIGWGQAYGNRSINIALPRVYRAALTYEEVQLRASGLPVTSKPVAEWTFNRQIREGLDPLAQITRARLNMRMSLPPSGQGANVKDTFEVNGYNHLYKNQDHREDLSYINVSQTKLNRAYGYFTYGAGSTIETSGFQNYYTELNFLDPMQPSGNYKSTRHANADMLANMDFHLVGLPSGLQISAAELELEYIPNSQIPLFTMGDVYRCAASSTIDAGTLLSHSLGNGGWHHKGWKLYGPKVVEESVFDNFYTFSEPSGNTRTYPETTRTYYFTGDPDDTVYADYLQYCPYGTTGDDGDVVPLLKDPKRRQYYRNPISIYDLAPEYWLISGRPITSWRRFLPSYYTNAIYRGPSLKYWDGDLDNIDESELALSNICQIFFEDRLSLTEDFTLYFMLYRNYGSQTYGRFFHRGLTEADGIENYEIVGDLEPNLVRFRVQGANGVDNEVEVEIDGYTREPILIWFNCGYEQETDDMTTMTLSVHDDIDNYFASDWKRSTVTFTGRRKMYSTGSSGGLGGPIGGPIGGDDPIIEGGPRTVLGTLETIDFNQQLSRRLYLHRVSNIEFGYANSYIDLDYQTSTQAVQLGYDISADKDKYFLSTRVSNSKYLQSNPSGVRWTVPYGSGAAEWSTSYNLFEWTKSGGKHSIFNPVSTAGTNNIVAPSAVYVDLEAAHSTDHPSGVIVYVDVEFDSGTSDNWKVAHIEFNVPSGGAVWTQYAPIDYRSATSKHINMDEGSINISDLENINVTVTTKYPNLGLTEYEGSITIHSLNVYFDSFCVAGTGLNTLDLYTYGKATKLEFGDDTNLDLYVKGKVTVPTNPNDGALDLYVYGWPHLASGDITLYTKADYIPLPQPGDPNATRMPLYINGLDWPNESGNLKLFMWATPPGVGGIYDKTTLYVRSDLDPKFLLPLTVSGKGDRANTSMNMYLHNYPWINPWDTMTLYTVGPSGIKGIGGNYLLQLPDGSILDIGFNLTGPLVLSEDPNVCFLYIRGDGINDGWYPKNTDMILYIDRNSEATASKLPLYMSQHGVPGTLNQYIYGHGVPASSIPLYIHGSGISTTSELELYTHGF